MFSSLGNSKVFSKVDLKHAFQRMVTDEKSQKLCTVNRYLGLFRPQRLLFRVADSAAIWQQTMDKVFGGLPGTVCFIDDIPVVGKDIQEHQLRLK